MGRPLALLLGREQWYLFLDGITSISKRSDLWIVQHYNGWRLVVPASAISHGQIEFLHKEMRRGQTPEGVRTVIERGKKSRQFWPSNPSGRQRKMAAWGTTTITARSITTGPLRWALD